ncbi:hypothetical protein BTR23_00435 [Alkalihalophilus pseudofirmus]|uniref:hypothetical protein n=1 Tax=Alkalihalobacterium alkalinitrilicum TaxID=427920 RepID=UPI00094DA9C5|nr:hypothetical protein [Alkalihalobacterium alkalinitrilicum]OLO42519.1 hypothetical protein BTR23_00435 [Alkalihalophilus pseudofirmus]
MMKKLTMLTAFLFTLFLVPVSTVLAAGGGEAAEGAAEPSGLIMISLTVLSFVTLIYMVYLNFSDHN